VASIRRGDVSGMSFSFRAVKDDWSKGGAIRTVQDMLVREVSVCTFPAYSTTEVAMRSLALARQVYPRGRTVAERQAWLTAVLKSG